MPALPTHNQNTKDSQDSAPKEENKEKVDAA
jgi:hypothetical protein